MWLCKYYFLCCIGRKVNASFCENAKICLSVLAVTPPLTLKNLFGCVIWNSLLIYLTTALQSHCLVYQLIDNRSLNLQFTLACLSQQAVYDNNWTNGYV